MERHRNNRTANFITIIHFPLELCLMRFPILLPQSVFFVHINWCFFICLTATFSLQFRWQVTIITYVTVDNGGWIAVELLWSCCGAATHHPITKRDDSATDEEPQLEAPKPIEIKAAGIHQQSRWLHVGIQIIYFDPVSEQVNGGRWS